MYNAQKFCNSIIYNEKNIVFFIFLFSFIIKSIQVILLSSGPTIPDEFSYKFNADLILNHKNLTSVHYPPLYSILILPGLLFSNWYDAILVINVFTICLTIPLSWLLAKQVGSQQPVTAAIFTALLPFLSVYPHYLYSENLLIPAFCFALTLAVRGHQAKLPEGILFGAVLAATHLTKYLALPAIPLMYIAWLRLRLTTKPTAATPSAYSWLMLLAPVCGYAVVFGAWLWYGHANGFSWSNLMGLGISAAGRWAEGLNTAAARMPKHANITSFLMWCSAYFSHSVLLWLPFVATFAVWAGQSHRKFSRLSFPNTPRSIFLTLTVLFFAGYWLLSSLHSFGAPYNYPTPKRLISRYAIHLAPLMGVCASLALESLQSNFDPHKIRISIYFSISVIILGVLSWFNIVFHPIWQFPSWFYKNSVNLINMNSLEFIIFISISLLSSISILLLRNKKLNSLFLLIMPLCFVLIFHTTVISLRLKKFETASHLRQAFCSIEKLHENGKKIHITLDNVNLSDKYFQKSSVFWTGKPLKYTSGDIPVNNSSIFMENEFFLISDKIYSAKYIKKYNYKDKNFFIYKIEEENMSLITNIPNYGSIDDNE